MPSTPNITPSPTTYASLINHKTGEIRTVRIVANPSTNTTKTYTPFSFLPNHGLVHPANRQSCTSDSSSSKSSVYSNEEKKSVYSDTKSMASSGCSTDSFDSVREIEMSGEVQGRRVYLSKRERVAARFGVWRREQREFWNKVGPVIVF